MAKQPNRYLSSAEFAARIGVVPSALAKYKVPPPDALIGTIRGWKVATVDKWQEQRPGRGWRKGTGEYKPRRRMRPAQRDNID